MKKHERRAVFSVFRISLTSDEWFSAFFGFPPRGKVSSRCYFVFPRKGKPFFAVFLFSLIRKSWFLLNFDFPPWGKADFPYFLFIRGLGQPIFLIFYPSEASDSQEAIPLILGTRRKTRKLLSPAWLLIMSNSAQLELGLFNCSQIPRNSTVLRLQSRLEKKAPHPWHVAYP